MNDGIYLTFNDFLNNKPFAIDFDYMPAFEKIKLTDVKKDDSIFTEKSWGFCKNGIPYIRVGNEFSRLTKIQNTFELRAIEALQFIHVEAADAFWRGFDIESDIKSGLPMFAILDITRKKPSNTINKIVPFKLDMQTGEVY